MPAGGWLAWCLACEDFAGPYADEDRAVQACGGHDDRYHEGRPTAEVFPDLAVAAVAA